MGVGGVVSTRLGQTVILMRAIGLRGVLGALDPGLWENLQMRGRRAIRDAVMGQVEVPVAFPGWYLTCHSRGGGGEAAMIETYGNSPKKNSDSCCWSCVFRFISIYFGPVGHLLAAAALAFISPPPKEDFTGCGGGGVPLAQKITPH